VLTAKSNIAVIQSLTKTIKEIENAVKSQAKLRKEFQLLKTIPGIGDHRLVATKALGNKLARASYYIMRDQVAYDSSKLFG